MKHRCWLACASRGTLLLVVALALASPALAATANGEDEIPSELSEALNAAMREKIKELGEVKNEYGKSTKRASFSRHYRKVDDGSYQTTLIVSTASNDQMVTERFLVTMKDQGGQKWAITGEDLQETYDQVFRPVGGNCYPFGEFSFDREGMTMRGSNGAMCEYYRRGKVIAFDVVSDDLAFDYKAPEYNDYNWIQQILMARWEDRAIFDPIAHEFRCDSETCEELIAECFTGLERRPASEEKPDPTVGASIPSRAAHYIEAKIEKERKKRQENPFRSFNTGTREGNRYYLATARKNDQASVTLYYDNWGGFEVQFVVEWTHPVYGHVDWPGYPLFGYYTEETLARSSPYELEQRDDAGNRFHEVFKLRGEVEAGLVDDQTIEADLEIGIRIKQEVKELPFAIAGQLKTELGGGDKPPSLRINSIEMDGEELTYIMGVGVPAELSRFGVAGGIIVFPEPLKAGSKVTLRMDYATEALRRITPSYTSMTRFGWIPFVRFADFVDDFAMTIKTPAEYEVLGIGHKVSEEDDGKVRTSYWKADNPVVFPSIIFGKYFSDGPGKDPKTKKPYVATKVDGTVIPVEVHVDEVSLTDWDIKPKALEPIATQAAASINLYRELSGVDYPYGELNLVNDPEGFLYGQAPSSLIYLGSGVFRGSGFLTSVLPGANATYISKFLKSVTAHEVGHQWWGSRVSNANDRNYWFVESLAEYFSAIYLERAFGSKDYLEQVEEWRRTILDRDQKSSVQHASVLFPGEDLGGSYQAAVYNKGPYAFHLLRQIFGDEKFFPFLKEFSIRLAEKGEIVTRDIQAVAEETLGGVDPQTGERYNVDLSWFFDQWIRGVGVPEYRFIYDVRDTEDGGAIVQGTLYQRIIVGNQRDKHVLGDKTFRSVVPITALLKKNQEATYRVIVEGPETKVQFKVSQRPLEVVVNKYNQTLSFDPVVNKSW